MAAAPVHTRRLPPGCLLRMSALRESGTGFSSGVAVNTRTSWLRSNTLFWVGSMFVKYGSAPAKSWNCVDVSVLGTLIPLRVSHALRA